ncbi:MAG TPA: hypothetical protein VFB77_15755 [Acidimicrobiales bacterium]|nr:hypothetical protein [Acidimicrobiales bacterium]
MSATLHIHDEVIDAIVQGEPVPELFAPLVVFAQEVRLLEDAPAPSPSPELADLLASRVRVAGLTGKVAGLGLVAKLGLGTSVAVAGITAAGVAGVLPAAANDVVRGAVEVVSPVDFDGDDHGTTNVGDRVAPDATGESDGETGVDGQQISEDAPGAANRPASGPADEPPGQSGETGLTRANQTPAAPHAPDAPAAASAPAGDAGTAGEPGDPDGDGVQGSASGAGRPDIVPSTVPELGNDDESAGE